MNKKISSNRRASFDYEFDRQIEMGLVLTGKQVRSIRDNSVTISESFGYIFNREIFLKNLCILKQNIPIKLLANRAEINKIIGTFEKKSYVLIPIEIYDKNGLIKVLIGLGKKSTKFDKREKIKKREIAREFKYID